MLKMHALSTANHYLAVFLQVARQRLQQQSAAVVNQCVGNKRIPGLVKATTVNHNLVSAHYWVQALVVRSLAIIDEVICHKHGETIVARGFALLCKFVSFVKVAAFTNEIG